MDNGMRWFIGGGAALTVFVMGNTRWVYCSGLYDLIPYVCIFAIGMGMSSVIRKIGS